MFSIFYFTFTKHVCFCARNIKIAICAILVKDFPCHVSFSYYLIGPKDATSTKMQKPWAKAIPTTGPS